MIGTAIGPRGAGSPGAAAEGGRSAGAAVADTGAADAAAGGAAGSGRIEAGASWSAVIATVNAAVIGAGVEGWVGSSAVAGAERIPHEQGDQKYEKWLSHSASPFCTTTKLGPNGLAARAVGKAPTTSNTCVERIISDISRAVAKTHLSQVTSL